MSVICPRCQAQCGDDDTYCFRCGTILPGASGRSAAADSGQVEQVPPVGPAATWPTADEPAAEPTVAYVPPPRSTSETAGDDEPDFVPLQFDSSGIGSGGPRRWLVLAAVLLALLVTGAAAAMIWQNAGDDGDDDVSQVALDPSPTPADGGVVIATPANLAATPAPADGRAATPAMTPSASPAAGAPPVSSSPAAATGFAAVTSNPTSPAGTPPAATPEPTATLAPTATEPPTVTPSPTATATAEPTAVAPASNRRAALADVALLPSGVLRSLAGDGGTPAATPDAGAATPAPRGDGTGGVILLPAESTALPAGESPQQTPTPETD